MAGASTNPRLIGRTDESARLVDLLASVDLGARSVFIDGELGIGKSRLLATFLDQSATESTQILRAGADPLGSTVPYGPFAELLRDLVAQRGVDGARELAGAGATDLASILPAIGATPTSIESTGSLAQTRLFEAFLALVATAAAESPLVIIVEDLHWADASSRSLLTFLVRNLRRERVLVIGTYRPDATEAGAELRRMMAELGRLPTVERIELGPLTTEQVRDLLTAIAGAAVAPEVARSIALRAGGNPLFVEGLFAHGASNGPLPTSVREILVERLDRAGPEVRAALRVAALTVGTVDDGLVSGVLGTSDDTAAETLRAALAAQLLDHAQEGTHAGYRLRLPILRDLLDEELAPIERRRLHARLASLLAVRALRPGETPTGRAFELAGHWLEAGDLEQARPAVLEAAELAERAYAWPEAHALLERASTMDGMATQNPPRTPIGFRPDADPTPARLARSRELLRRTAEAASLAGRPARAAELARSALDTSTAADDAALLYTRLGRYLWEAGRRIEAFAVFEKGVDAVPVDDPYLARLLATWARLLLLDGDNARSSSVAKDAVGRAERSSDRTTQWSASMTLGAALAQLGQLAEADLVVEGANRLVGEASLSVLMNRPSRIADMVGSYGDAATALDRLGRSDEALAMARRGADVGRRLGAPTWGGLAASAAATEMIRVGRWTEAAEELENGLKATTGPMAEAELHAARARIRTLVGDLVAAEEDLSQATDLMGSAPPAGLLIHVSHAIAEHAAWRGAVHRGRQAVDDGLVAATRSEDYVAGLALSGVGLRLEADAAETARARRIPAETTEALERGLMLHGRAVVAASRLGGLAILAGRVRAELSRADAERARLEGEPDVGVWQALVAARDGQTEPFESAYARWRLGEAQLHARQERGAAERTLREALVGATALGAAGLRQEIEAVGRRARINLAPETVDEDEPVPSSPAAGLGLSERELEVLTLVADGRTNREIGQALFITEKTAGHHVSNILAKLGVASRVEAAAVAHRAGVATWDRGE